VPRNVKPPDFRYVWLTPGPSSTAVTAAIGSIGTAALGVALWGADPRALSLGLTLGVGAVAAFALTNSDRRALALRGAREVAMAIVPWGVIVAPDTEPRVLRWPAVRRVTVDVKHALRGGTPSILASVVTVETDREILAGRASGAVGLERLVANLEAYAEESARPPARDLDGDEPMGDDATEPIAALLVRRAEELCASGAGAARLLLPPSGYRSVASRRAAPETLNELNEALKASSDALADPRPLAAILAGMLGARELVPDLLRLVSSPHPMVAAFAKAAALRLGAPLNQAGAVDELGPFLFDEDLDVIKAWAQAEGTLALAAPETA
jgi:hypothetical protein